MKVIIFTMIDKRFSLFASINSNNENSYKDKEGHSVRMVNIGHVECSTYDKCSIHQLFRYRLSNVDH